VEIAVGAVISDRFVVLGRIGAGAVAVVYLVRHLQLGSLHAIKVLLIPTPFVQQRLLQEGRLQSTLRDPHVVAVTDVVDVEGAPGLVMDFVRGPSLERLLQHIHFDPHQAIAVGAGILAGMRAAHQAGMVHRDLKPANVLVDVTDTQLVPKIADFGLAKILHSDESAGLTATRTGSTLGTPAYMAPEQIRDARNVDERADIFALGCLLYELLTGHRAFPGDDLLDLFDRIRDGRYRAVRSLSPEVPQWLEAVVDDALRPDRDERIGSVAELHDRWTQGRGDQAAEIDWSPTLLALATSLAPEAASGAPSAGGATPVPPSGATFDLATPEPEPDKTDLAGTIGDSSVDSVDLPIVPGIEIPARPRSAGEPREAHEPPPPPRALHVPGRRRFAAALLLLSVSLSTMMVCGGSAGVVGVGLTMGWLQLGPRAPVQVTESAGRPVYGSRRELPAISEDPALQAHHDAGWLAIRQGRLHDALHELRIVAEAEAYDDLGLRLLLATAEIGVGDASGYKRLQQTAELAATRRGPLADLARIAGDAVQTGPDTNRVKRHLSVWPEDELARLLLARLDGWEGEQKVALIQEAIERDPDMPGPLLLLVEHWLEKGSLSEASVLLDKAERTFPGDPGLGVARARWLLMSGRPAEARRLVEGLGQPPRPESLQVHAAALRDLGDLSALDGIYQGLPPEDLALRVAFARGRAESAFGLGQIEEALEWLARGFEEASVSGRLDDMADLARLHQQFAALLGRPEDLTAALDRARIAASLLGMPGGLHARLTSRILLLEGLLALDSGDGARVQLTIERLEDAERGERLAAILRAAALARQGSPTAPFDDLPTGCVGRLLGARWRELGKVGEVESVFSALALDETPCLRTGVDRYVRAEAETYLALAALARQDYEAVEEHLGAFRAWIPDPELGSPLHTRVSDVEEALAWRETD
jgi:serine/threonine protein kinase/tetratricopeptide (TPR) repeat protein